VFFFFFLLEKKLYLKLQTPFYQQIQQTISV